MAGKGNRISLLTLWGIKIGSNECLFVGHCPICSDIVNKQ